MKLKQILVFFGLGKADPSPNRKIYDEIAKDKPVIVQNNRTPLEVLIDNHDPAMNGLWELKSPGEKLRRIRKARGLTQTELGKMARVSKSTIGEIENSKWKTTSLTTAHDIARQLKVEVEDIWTTVLNK